MLLTRLRLVTIAVAVIFSHNTLAQEPGQPTATPRTKTVVCGSSAQATQRNHCRADISAGVMLVKPTGTAECLLGKTWGYDNQGIWVADGCGGEFATGEQMVFTGEDTAKTSEYYGRYTPNLGFKVADTPRGDLNFRVWSYVRYLNQNNLDETYTNAFGHTSTLDLRQDIQIQKVTLYFYGWLWDPKFRYLLYVWTSNTSQGRGAQVVVAGFLSYAFNDRFVLGGGINGLPGVRSTEGNSPFWLGVDNRLIADEYFRPSYTSGIWLKGKIVDRFDYAVMLGNNLSQLGIDSGQLDASLNTLSAALTWMPTTGEYGRGGDFGDFANHQKLATRLGLHYTQSDESAQSQPNTDAFENVQIRVSDGSVVFAPNLFGAGISITDVLYQMASFDAGFKYRGFAVEGEYFWRRVSDFRGPGTTQLPFAALNDRGFQLQASAMLLPKTLQLYLSGSKIYGEYGNPYDTRLGVNWFPWKNEIARWNAEAINTQRSPVGALSLPYSVGGTGTVFTINFEVRF